MDKIIYGIQQVSVGVNEADVNSNIQRSHVKTIHIVNNFLQPHLPSIMLLFEKHKVKDAYLFGSVLTNKFDENSDVDFLINFNDNLDPVEKGELLWNLRFSLEDNLKRPIDLITESSLKNPFFIEELNETKQKIYG